MNRKIVVAFAIVMCVAMAVVVIESVNSARTISAYGRADTNGVTVGETSGQYIYIGNPTWDTAEAKSYQANVYVNGELWWSSEVFYPDTWLPERWDVKVLPFEESVVIWYRWIVLAEEPKGKYNIEHTIIAEFRGEDIELKAWTSFRVT